ncbi:prepilin peptidase [Neisseria sp. Ec49-e6-T10]|uniref:prepilin peptidase n=1 Tax=Neisseria sp. Ec49-e6-T10 TaxID=3140744 RepID=UPI003EC0B727
MFELFRDNVGLFTCVALFFGLLVGSFLNVVIYRLPKMLENTWNHQCQIQLNLIEEETPPPVFNLVVPHSACPNCQAPIRPWQNIPIVSYIFLKGACAKCGTHISIRYPLVELLTGILFAMVAWKFGVGLPALGGMLFSAFLVSMIFIDADTQLLPDNLTLPLLWFGLALSLFETYISVKEAVIGAMVGYLFLWIIFWLFKILTKKEGMGYGDFKLLAALGAWLGVAPLLVVILLSAILGFFYYGLIIMTSKQKTEHKNIPFAFGPSLACAGWIAFMYGKNILSWLYPNVQF